MPTARNDRVARFTRRLFPVLGVGRHLVIGAGWMILARFADRAIGLVSTAVLARLLLPEDFGLVALAVSLIAILDMIRWVLSLPISARVT